MSKKINPALAGTSRPGERKTYKSDITRPLSKWKRVLSAFYEGDSLNRFEAERSLHDHCLHSTVSTIQAKGVAIHRKTERVPGFMGMPTEVCRYWLAPDSRQRAGELLELGEARHVA